MRISTLVSLLLMTALNALAQEGGAAHASGGPLTGAVAAGIGSFGLAVLIGIVIDNRINQRETKPGVDAYIDQMLAANGTHLRIDRAE